MTSQSPKEQTGLIGIKGTTGHQDPAGTKVTPYIPSYIVGDMEFSDLNERVAALEEKLQRGCPLFRKKKKGEVKQLECEDCSGLLF